MKKTGILKALLAFVIVITIISCKKESTPSSTSSATVAVKSKLDLITANVYIYDSVYNNWGLSNQGVVYVLGGANNQQDWSKERLKFYRDGTFDEILTTGVWRQGAWSMNSDSTILYTSGSGFSNTANIEKLVADTIIWRDPANKSRGVQIAKR